MTAPFELVSGPVTIYTATASTAAPEISDDPPTAWSTLGKNGAKNYGDGGVTITPEQSIEEQMVLGSTAPQKAFRTEEHLTLSVTLVDVTAETLAKVMNGTDVTDTVATSSAAGNKEFDLLRGSDVEDFALLVRGFSPYAASMNAQYWLPRAYVSSVGELNYAKGSAAGTEIVFAALEDSTDGFGQYIAQNTAKS